MKYFCNTCRSRHKSTSSLLIRFSRTECVTKKPLYSFRKYPTPISWKAGWKFWGREGSKAKISEGRGLQFSLFSRGWQTVCKEWILTQIVLTIKKLIEINHFSIHLNVNVSYQLNWYMYNMVACKNWSTDPWPSASYSFLVPFLVQTSEGSAAHPVILLAGNSMSLESDGGVTYITF